MPDLLTQASDIIEADFAALQTTYSRSPALSSLDEPDVTVYWSENPLARLNVIASSQIAPGATSTRVPELLAPFFDRGRPFQWMTTPRTTTPALEAALAQAGLRAREYPAMHTSLSTPIDPATPQDIFVDVVWPDGVESVSRLIIEALGHPARLRAGSLGVLDSLDPDENQFFVARSLHTGEVLGASTMHTRDNSAMLANVSTPPAGHGRGVERALIGTMMNRAASTGIRSATLVTNSRDYPYFIELGFRTQFTVVGWIWDPSR